MSSQVYNTKNQWQCKGLRCR